MIQLPQEELADLEAPLRLVLLLALEPELELRTLLRLLALRRVHQLALAPVALALAVLEAALPSPPVPSSPPRPTAATPSPLPSAQPPSTVALVALAAAAQDPLLRLALELPPRLALALALVVLAETQAVQLRPALPLPPTLDLPAQAALAVLAALAALAALPLLPLELVLSRLPCPVSPPPSALPLSSCKMSISSEQGVGAYWTLIPFLFSSVSTQHRGLYRLSHTRYYDYGCNVQGTLLY